MSYHLEMKQLLTACGCESAIYTRKPVKGTGEVQPLTPQQRRQVERLSKERGYRRIVVDFANRV